MSLTAMIAAGLAALPPVSVLAQAEPTQPPPGAQPVPQGPGAAPPPGNYAPPTPPPSMLAPTAEDYATQAGNVPPGVTPREYKFETPRDYPRNEFGMMIGVPIWFSPGDSVIAPGFSIEGRYARRFGALAPEFAVGWQINWLDKDKLPASVRNADLTIDTFFLSAGLRVYVLPESGVSPFISGAFDLSFWHFAGDTQTVCGYYYCNDVANYEATVGFSGRVGIAFIPNPRFQLEIGARVAMAFPIGPFDTTQGWVTPYLGFMGRM
jgi:hypothetical protein